MTDKLTHVEPIKGLRLWLSTPDAVEARVFLLIDFSGQHGFSTCNLWLSINETRTLAQALIDISSELENRVNTLDTSTNEIDPDDFSPEPNILNR